MVSCLTSLGSSRTLPKLQPLQNSKPMSILRLLVPPYRQLVWQADGVPPLGSVTIVAADSAESVAGLLTPLLRRAPWCVPCLVTGSATATPRVLVAIHELPGQPAFVSGPVDDRGLVGPVVDAVRSRPSPGGARLADYVVRRTERPDLRFELANLLAIEPPEPIVADLPERTLRDRLSRFGSFGSHCWRAVGSLARLATKQEGGSVEGLATSAGVGPRTLRSWVRRYLDVSMAEFRSRIGWEWVIERALRVGGYAEAPQWAKAFSLRPATASRATAATPPTLRVSHPRALRRWSRSVVTELPVELSALDPRTESAGSDGVRARALPGGEGFD